MESKNKELGKLLVTVELVYEDFKKNLASVREDLDKFIKDFSNKTININLFGKASNEAKSFQKDIGNVQKSIQSVAKTIDKQTINPNWGNKDLKEIQNSMPTVKSAVDEVTKGINGSTEAFKEQLDVMRQIEDEVKLFKSDYSSLSFEQLKNKKISGKELIQKYQATANQSANEWRSAQDQITTIKNSEIYKKHLDDIKRLSDNINIAKKLEVQPQTFSSLEKLAQKLEQSNLGIDKTRINGYTELIKQIESVGGVNRKITNEMKNDYQRVIGNIIEMLKRVRAENEQAWSNSKAAQDLNILNKKLDYSADNVRKTNVVLKEMRRNLGDITLEMSKVSKEADNFKKMPQIFNKFDSSIKRLGNYILRMSLAVSGMSGLFWVIRNSMADLISRNEGMIAATKGLSQALAQALTPILIALVPLFQKIVVWITFTINAVIMLMNTLFNMNMSIVKVFNPLPAKIGKGTKALNKMKKAAQSLIAPFDKLNIINEFIEPSTPPEAGLKAEDIIPDFGPMNKQLEEANKKLDFWGEKIEWLRGKGDEIVKWAKRIGIALVAMWGISKVLEFIGFIKYITELFSPLKSAIGGAKSKTKDWGKNLMKAFGAILLIDGSRRLFKNLLKPLSRATDYTKEFYDNLLAAAEMGAGTGMLSGDFWVGLSTFGIGAAMGAIKLLIGEYHEFVNEVNTGNVADKLLLMAEKTGEAERISERTFKFTSEAISNFNREFRKASEEVDNYKRIINDIDTGKIVDVDGSKRAKFKELLKKASERVSFYGGIIERVDPNGLVTFTPIEIQKYDEAFNRIIIPAVEAYEKAVERGEATHDESTKKMSELVKKYKETHQNSYDNIIKEQKLYDKEMLNSEDITKAYSKSNISWLDKVKLAFDTLWEGAGKLFDKVKITFGNIKSEIERKLGEIHLPDWITGPAKFIGGALGQISQAITKFKSPTLNFNVNPNFTEEVKNKLKQFNIPGLAKGGVIHRPTLAMIGEYAGANGDPEIVAPQSTLIRTMEEVLNKFNGGGQNNPTQITLINEIGGYRFGRKVIEIINDTQIEAGEVLLNV